MAAIYREWEDKVKGSEMVVGFVSSQGKKGAPFRHPFPSTFREFSKRRNDRLTILGWQP